MAQTLREQLRALPDFPENLPSFEPDQAPEEPGPLFLRWLDEAIAAGLRQPHAMSLATTNAAGRVSSRMLILKDLDADGWHFATSRTSRKASELDQQPRAAMNFFWAELGRQVRVAGAVTPLSAEASERDWQDRPGADGSRNPEWQLYALRPAEVEFWQGSHDRRHLRLRYVADGGRWRKGRPGREE